MRAGLLNKTISIHAYTATARSTSGEPVEAQSTVLAGVWARVDPKTGKEDYRQRSRWENVEADFFIRWTTVSITPSMSVGYDGNEYDIKAVINTGESNRELQLITERRS